MEDVQGCSSPPMLASTAGELQRGGQGVLHLEDCSGNAVAVKVMPSGPKRSRSYAWEAEARSLRRLGTPPNQHLHIVHCFGVENSEERREARLMLQLADTDLLEVLGKAPDSRLPEALYAREWLAQVTHALAHCHSLNIAHRDVKPENVLIMQWGQHGAPAPHTPDGGVDLAAVQARRLERQTQLAEWVAGAGRPADESAAQQGPLQGFIAKLCDFGSALVGRRAKPMPRGRSPSGSPRYVCPQVCFVYMRESSPREAEALWPEAEVQAAGDGTPAVAGYDAFAADVWSVGVLLFVAFAGTFPFRSGCIASRRFREFVKATQPHVLQDFIMCPSSAVWTSNQAAEGGAPAAPFTDTGGGTWQWPETLSPGLMHLISQCLRVRERERPSMAEVRDHPWWQNPGWMPDTPIPGTLRGEACKRSPWAGRRRRSSVRSGRRRVRPGGVHSYTSFASSSSTVGGSGVEGEGLPPLATSAPLVDVPTDAASTPPGQQSVAGSSVFSGERSSVGGASSTAGWGSTPCPPSHGGVSPRSSTDGDSTVLAGRTVSSMSRTSGGQGHTTFGANGTGGSLVYTGGGLAPIEDTSPREGAPTISTGQGSRRPRYDSLPTEVVGGTWRTTGHSTPRGHRARSTASLAAADPHPSPTGGEQGAFTAFTLKVRGGGGGTPESLPPIHQSSHKGARVTGIGSPRSTADPLATAHRKR